MKPFVLIACSKTKDPNPEKMMAMYRYKGDLFKKSLAYATTLTDGDHIFILSARYFVLKPTDFIEDYNETLNNMKKRDRKVWSRLVMDILEWNITKYPDPHEFVVLCGEKYIEFIETELNTFGEVRRPLKGLGIGQQLKHLKERVR